MGHTNATKHKIILKDLDTPPFKEHFHRIIIMFISVYIHVR